ncbi:MAG: hypothetical protein N2749_03585 [Clostridia bacterium]|nr:hypothetical protein [Clostridia bacterium]
MKCCPERFFNLFLIAGGVKVPIGKCHYMTGLDIFNLKNTTCIENTLTNLTCKCKSLFKR